MFVLVTKKKLDFKNADQNRLKSHTLILWDRHFADIKTSIILVKGYLCGLHVYNHVSFRSCSCFNFFVLIVSM